MDDEPENDDLSTSQVGSDLDEVVSAVLDGEASTEEIAAVDADAELSRRLHEFGRARSLHRDLFDTSDDEGDRDQRREQRIAIALKALDTYDIPSPDPSPQEKGSRMDGSAAGTVVGIDAAGRSRRRLGWVASVAAVVVLLSVGAIVVRSIDEGGSDSFAANDTTTEARPPGVASADEKAAGQAPSTTVSPQESPAMDHDAGASAGAAPRSEESAPDGIGSAAPVFLGDFTDVHALRVAALGALDGATGTGSAPPSCAASLVGAEPGLTASARLDGAAVVVVIRSTVDGGTPSPSDVSILDPVTCASLG